jgi:signal transduction histidine kinase
MDTILSLILTEISESLGIDRGLILRLKYDNPILVAPYPQAIPQAKVEVSLDWNKQSLIPTKLTQNEPLSYHLSDSPLTILAWEKLPNFLIINSHSELKNLKIKEDIKQFFDLSQIKSLLFLPLFSNTNIEERQVILGFLVLQKYRNHKWNNNEIKMAKWVALQTSSSILNQQSLKKVQSLVDERTAQLKISLDVQAKLSEKMRQNLEELRRLNKIKDQFISNLSDALKTPLANIKVATSMLRLFMSNKKSEIYLNVLESECEKEINLVNDLLTLQQLAEKKLVINPQKLNIPSIFAEIIAELTPKLTERKLTVKSDFIVTEIYSDLPSFQFILKELLHNASKFSTPNTTITVKINQDPEQITISVTNMGRQISPSEREHLFEPFYQCEGVGNSTNSGTGLGLALVKSLVENLEGNITVESSPSPNSSSYLNSFTLTLPCLHNLL